MLQRGIVLPCISAGRIELALRALRHDPTLNIIHIEGVILPTAACATCTNEIIYNYVNYEFDRCCARTASELGSARGLPVPKPPA